MYEIQRHKITIQPLTIHDHNAHAMAKLVFGRDIG